MENWMKIAAAAVVGSIAGFVYGIYLEEKDVEMKRSAMVDDDDDEMEVEDLDDLYSADSE